MRPLVTICCSTYNHGSFIKEALDSFVMQDTNFPFEIIINDDASTDATQDILKKYAKNYPYIKLILHKENQWGEGMLDGTFFGFEPFVYNIMPKAKGKYLAFCEGDDFWTDPLKLQKQVDYLESHPDCSMCYHSYATLSNGLVIERTNDKIGKYYTSEELFSVPNGIASSTKMFRNIYSEETKEAIQAFRGDYLFTSYMGLHGDCGYVRGVKNSIYRLHKDGIWTSLGNIKQRIRYQEMLDNLYNLHLKYGTPKSAAVRKSSIWDKETFGIVLPTYQRKDGKTPELLNRALRSIFAQTYTKFKVYLIGDKYDNQVELSTIVSQYPAEHIYYENLSIAHERDKYSDNPKAIWCSGGVFAHNYAISKIEEDKLRYVCFLDHDDQWLPNHLQILHDVIKETGANWLCTKTDVNNKIMYLPRITTDQPMVEFLPLAEGLIKSSSCFDVCTIPLRFRDVLAETGELFPSDADLWKRMNSLIRTYGLKSYYINTLTCIYVSGGIKKPLDVLVPWTKVIDNPVQPRPNVRRITWRDKLAMAQDRLIIKQSNGVRI